MVAGIATSAPALAKHTGGQCVQAGGEATMVTEDLAKFMAGAALKNSIAAHGWTPHGQVRMNCDTNSVLPHCVAKQKACG
ncbi:MAG: hypothetical protein K2X41_07970 [Hyphomicrobium sp.]|nr:hypothetical protein [Hyphomicrobium sp.]